MQITIIYILVAIAAILNAAMDRTENLVSFNRSIFNHLDTKFWCKEVSWQYAAKIFSWKADCWHIAKSGMVICLITAILIAAATGVYWLYLAGLYPLWNLVFNTCYNHLMKR